MRPRPRQSDFSLKAAAASAWSLSSPRLVSISLARRYLNYCAYAGSCTSYYLHNPQPVRGRLPLQAATKAIDIGKLCLLETCNCHNCQECTVVACAWKLLSGKWHPYLIPRRVVLKIFHLHFTPLLNEHERSFKSINPNHEATKFTVGSDSLLHYRCFTQQLQSWRLYGWQTRQLRWAHSHLELVFVAHSSTENAPVFSPEKLYLLTVNFHNTFVYPHNLAEANKINSTVFAEDCQGNIDITRTFVGRELNTEYVFGSFAQVGKTNRLNLLGSPQTWNMTHWTGFQNNVNFAVTFQMFMPVLNITLPLEIWTWLSFNVSYQPSTLVAMLTRPTRRARERSLNTTLLSDTLSITSKPFSPWEHGFCKPLRLRWHWQIFRRRLPVPSAKLPRLLALGRTHSTLAMMLATSS